MPTYKIELKDPHAGDIRIKADTYEVSNGVYTFKAVNENVFSIEIGKVHSIIAESKLNESLQGDQMLFS